ncbi:MAG: hypothetical protein QS748_06245 [Candidatus Endonucleobacter bathymodioli]|uniref:Non-specific serine/threonine protein kinase n=1 Tax=Candidatus Endonucleibacter bathymodioli TaxID=539814 RepID=A0AA90NL95_9GAMM|nr:hypothetical protein [Candidatus Endonucleobacter bathymodioli]
MNFLNFCCSLLCSFTVSELAASPDSNILSAQNAIIFIKKDPDIKIEQSVIIEISTGETIFFDDNQINMLDRQGVAGSEEFCFSSGGSVYIFFRKGDNISFPHIENANNYYVFNLIDRVQQIVSDGDSREEDENFQALVGAHPVIHVYDDNQWMVVDDHNVDESWVASKHDVAVIYLTTVFAHTKWSVGVSDQMVSYVKHKTNKVVVGGKTNKLCYRYTETFVDDFIKIDPVCRKETSSKPLSAQQFFSHWTSRPLATNKIKYNVPANLSHLTLDDSITDTHFFVSNTPTFGRKHNPQNAFTRQVSSVQAQQVEERDSSKHFPVQSVTEHSRSSDYIGENNDHGGYQGQRVSTHQALIKSQIPHHPSQKILIANPMSQSELKEIVGKLKPLYPYTLELRGKQYAQTHYISRSSGGAVYLGVDENGEYVAIKRIFKSEGRVHKQGKCRKTVSLQSGQLEHPFALRFIDVCKVGDFEYQIMPYLPLTMSQVRSRQNDWPVGTSWLILRQLLTVVSFYHKNSITNLDIKPNNILLSADGASIQVTDFGAAETVQSSGMTQSILGTLEYMTPAHVLAYKEGHLVNQFYADLAAVALTIIYMEINKTILNRPKNTKNLTKDDVFSMLGQKLEEFGWSDSSSTKNIKSSLEKLFSDNGRPADDILLGLLAKMLTASSADQFLASRLLGEYFSDEVSKGNDKKIQSFLGGSQKRQRFFEGLGFAVENVPSDGNCLYSAMALSMKRNLSDNEYSYILQRMPRIEGEEGDLVTSRSLRCYLHNLLSVIISTIDKVNDTKKREMYREQLTNMLGEDYPLLKGIVTNKYILLSAGHPKCWGDGSIVSTLLVLSFNLSTRIMTTKNEPELASLSGLQELCPELIKLLQVNFSIPSHYYNWGEGHLLRIIYANRCHYLAAYPVK